jgi:hypothetical protein
MRIQVRKNPGLNVRASSRPCRTRRSPCRSRRRARANADVAGFVPSRSAPRAKFFSAGIPRVDAWSFYRVIEMWSSVFASQQYSMPMSQLGHERRFSSFSQQVRFTPQEPTFERTSSGTVSCANTGHRLAILLLQHVSPLSPAPALNNRRWLGSRNHWCASARDL